jgi:tetratricopeptide (TPR) repeat protein
MQYHLLIAFAALSSLGVQGGQENAAQSSPVQMRIAAAQKRIQGEPKPWQAYNDVAFALCRWGRDNTDVTLYDQAGTALQRSFQLSPGNYDAKGLQVTVLLGKHEFVQALELAGELNRGNPDDIGGWGLLVDANVALGNYSEAERDAQWILDLRPGSSLGFEKAAGLRELFGDFEGAIEFFDEARRRASPSDADQQAWLLTQNARLQLASGNPKAAGELLAQALKLFPDSQRALAVLAQMRMADGNYGEAASLLEKRYRNVKSLANLYEWAEALEKSGQKEQALTVFTDFEAKARAEMTKPYNANRELIFFYTDHKSNPAEALTIATRETAIRHDSATLDAYAWALYRNGKYSEAKTQMDRALAVGVRNPVYFNHAAQIATKVNDLAAAKRFEKEVTALNGKQ